jgi:hypothetical protein
LYYTIGCDLCTSTATSGTLNNLGCSMPQPVLCESLILMIEALRSDDGEVEALDMGLFSRNSQCLLLLCQWRCVMWWKLYLCI